MRQIRAEREANGIPVIEESQDRWPLYLTKDVLYESMDVMLKALGNQVLPKYKSERFKHSKANAADKNYNRYWRK